MANPGALANLDDAAAIERLANGTMLKQIAAEYSVSKVAVYKRLRKHPDYQDAIACQAHSFIEEAMEDVRAASLETVNIARARVDAAFKYAKAHNPDYADKQQITVTVDLGERLRRANERVINADVQTQHTLIDQKTGSENDPSS